MKVTIITPTYNSEKYLQDCLNSIKNQQGISNDQVQHIIVDGKSEDNTLKILKNYKETVDYEVKIISSKDENMYDAINKGMKYIKGEIWGCLNSDDLYFHNTIKIVISCFKKYKKIEVIYGTYEAIDEKGNFLYRRNFPKATLKRLIDMKNSCFMPQPTTFAKVNVIKKIGYFNTKYDNSADYDYQIRIIKKVRIKKISKLLTKMRKHKDALSITQKKFQQKESTTIANRYGKVNQYLRYYDCLLFYMYHFNIKNISYMRKLIKKRLF